jgi:hypothetical protein
LEITIKIEGISMSEPTEIEVLKNRLAALEAAQAGKQMSTEFEQKRSGFLNGNSFGNTGKRLAQLKRDDPNFFEKLLSEQNVMAHPEDFFGRASIGSLAMALASMDKALYAKGKLQAAALGLIAREGLPLPDSDASPRRVGREQ